MKFSRTDLIKIKKLELISRKNVVGLLSGSYLTVISGSGFVFKEARKYFDGDPVRWIDWNLTAKFNEPYIRTYHDEREREIFIALDVSASMFVGFQEKTKMEYAIELASTLAYSAVQNEDKMGFLFFSDRLHYFYKPSKSKKAFYDLIYHCVRMEKQSYSRESDIRIAIHNIQKIRGRKFVIFIISDFIDYDIPEDMKFLKRWHDVNLFHVYDPVEYWRGKEIRIWSYSPEGKRNSGWISTKEIENLKEKIEFLKKLSYQFHVDFFSFSTKSSVSKSLTKFFHQKRIKVLK